MTDKYIFPPNYTQVPNVILDNQGNLTESGLRVMLAVCRKTFGWHKREDELSLSQLMKLTSMSRQGVINGIEDATAKGYLTRREKGRSFVYSAVVNEVDQSTVLTDNGQQSRPAVVNEVDTQNKSKETKENPAIAGATAQHPAIQAYRSAAHRFPPKAWYQRIVDEVGENDARVEAFRVHVYEWVGRGWNASNAKGILESFQKGGLDKRRPSTTTPGEYVPAEGNPAFRQALEESKKGQSDV